MKTKLSPAFLGAFVIGAFALLIIVLLSFGGVSFFAKPQRFVVYFDESIHGLTLGSPVKLRGVQVGRVVDLNVRYDGNTNRSVVAVVCELSKDKVTDPKGAAINVADRAALQTMVDRGLRARLDVQGYATGLLFVQLEFFDTVEYPADNRVSELKYVVVPAVPSTFSGLLASATEILSNLKRVDFAGLSVEVKKLLVDTRAEIAGVDFKGVTEQWKKTGASVDALVKTPEIKEAFVNLNATLGELRGVLGKLDTQVGANGAQLQATLTEAQKSLASFAATAASAQKFIAAQSGLGEDARRALRELAEAAESVQRLADFLERNPQALISGKKQPK